MGTRLGFDLESYDLQNYEVDSFKLMAETRRQLSEVSEQACLAVKQCYRSPGELKAFIESQGTPVYITRNNWLEKFMTRLSLKMMGLECGYIPPGSSERYQKLVAWLTRNEDHSPIYFDSTRFDNGVFVMTPELFTVSFLVHQLHHWMAFRSGLGGYSDQDQALYHDFWSKHQGRVSSKLLKDLSVEEIIGLKHAINRDLEALAFLKKMVEEIFIPSRQAKQLKS